MAMRMEAMKNALLLGVSGHGRKICPLFAVVVKKSELVGADPVEFAFEILSERFDLFLRRLHHKSGDNQRGLIIFDKASAEPRIQSMAREFKRRRGGTKHYADVPMFLDSKASRLIQLADLVSFAIYRKFSAGDDELFQIIEPFFDAEGGVVHGLHVHESASVARTPLAAPSQPVAATIFVESHSTFVEAVMTTAPPEPSPAADPC